MAGTDQGSSNGGNKDSFRVRDVHLANGTSRSVEIHHGNSDTSLTLTCPLVPDVESEAQADAQRGALRGLCETMLVPWLNIVEGLDGSKEGPDERLMGDLQTYIDGVYISAATDNVSEKKFRRLLPTETSLRLRSGLRGTHRYERIWKKPDTASSSWVQSMWDGGSVWTDVTGELEASIGYCGIRRPETCEINIRVENGQKQRFEIEVDPENIKLEHRGPERWNATIEQAPGVSLSFLEKDFDDAVAKQKTTAPGSSFSVTPNSVTLGPEAVTETLWTQPFTHPSQTLMLPISQESKDWVMKSGLAAVLGLTDNLDTLATVKGVSDIYVDPVTSDVHRSA